MAEMCARLCGDMSLRELYEGLIYAAKRGRRREVFIPFSDLMIEAIEEADALLRAQARREEILGGKESAGQSGD